eukprot:8608788-Heterocapsa_arctica.AAC.1
MADGRKSTQLAATTDDAKASPAASPGGDYQQYLDYPRYTQGTRSGGAQSPSANVEHPVMEELTPLNLPDMYQMHDCDNLPAASCRKPPPPVARAKLFKS